MSRFHFSYQQERCVRLAGKLMHSTGMAGPGARIGVAVSGGVDSWVLLKVLGLRQRIVPFHFDYMALHIDPGFGLPEQDSAAATPVPAAPLGPLLPPKAQADQPPEAPLPRGHALLTHWLAANGVAGHVEESDFGPRAHSQENRKRSACFYCAMLRRKRLFELCKLYGLTHLAFGHTAEDLGSTFLMNLFQTGRVEGMSANESFFKGSLQVIRPLLLVEKKLITRAASQWQLPVWSNPCPTAGKTTRQTMLDSLGTFCQGHKFRRTNFFNALCRWQMEKDSAIATRACSHNEQLCSLARK